MLSKHLCVCARKPVHSMDVVFFFFIYCCCCCRCYSFFRVIYTHIFVMCDYSPMLYVCIHFYCMYVYMYPIPIHSFMLCKWIVPFYFVFLFLLLFLLLVEILCVALMARAPILPENFSTNCIDRKINNNNKKKIIKWFNFSFQKWPFYAIAFAYFVYVFPALAAKFPSNFNREIVHGCNGKYSRRVAGKERSSFKKCGQLIETLWFIERLQVKTVILERKYKSTSHKNFHRLII